MADIIVSKEALEAIAKAMGQAYYLSTASGTDQVRTDIISALKDLRNIIWTAEAVSVSESRGWDKLIEEMFGRSVNTKSELYKLIADKED